MTVPQYIGFRKLGGIKQYYKIFLKEKNLGPLEAIVRIERSIDGKLPIWDVYKKDFSSVEEKMKWFENVIKEKSLKGYETMMLERPG